LRNRIRKEAPYVGVRPFSHNIIRLTLLEIKRKYSLEEANKAVCDFNLEAKGFNKEPENESDRR
jgi:hypothetical protein